MKDPVPGNSKDPDLEYSSKEDSSPGIVPLFTSMEEETSDSRVLQGQTDIRYMSFCLNARLSKFTSAKMLNN